LIARPGLELKQASQPTRNRPCLRSSQSSRRGPDPPRYAPDSRQRGRDEPACRNGHYRGRCPTGPCRSPALASKPHRPAKGRLTAEIRRTAGGIPHILARDWTSLWFGYGYAFAEDNLCTMADEYITLQSRRSRYFGPDGGYIQRGNGVVVSNLASDIFFQQIIDSRQPSTAHSSTERSRSATRGHQACKYRRHAWHRHDRLLDRAACSRSSRVPLS
jgi:hypothetical protein